MNGTIERLTLPSLAVGTSPHKGQELLDLTRLGFDIELGGRDQGYNAVGDVLTQTVDGRDLNEVWREFQAAVTLQNSKRQALIDFLTFPVTAPVEDVPIISGGQFEEASEYGVPKSIRGGAYHSLGYDFKWYDLAVRYTWMYLSEATTAQVESLNAMALEADNGLIFEKVMRSVFNNVTRVADIRGQAVNVYPFYNGDATVPPDYKNFTFTAPHTHFLTSGAATVDSGDLDDLELHLKHHGYGKQAGARMILMVNSQESAVIRTFRVASGDSNDFIPSQGSAPLLVPQNMVLLPQGTSLPSNNIAGLTVVGTYGPWTVVEEDYIPAGYLFGFATGGEKQATNPIGFRQHANAGLRGLRLVKGRDNDYPLIDSYYNRGFGTGVRHRGAGVVMQIKVAAGYVIPTAYA